MVYLCTRTIVGMEQQAHRQCVGRAYFLSFHLAQFNAMMENMQTLLKAIQQLAVSLGESREHAVGLRQGISVCVLDERVQVESCLRIRFSFFPVFYRGSISLLRQRQFFVIKTADREASRGHSRKQRRFAAIPATIPPSVWQPIAFPVSCR